MRNQILKGRRDNMIREAYRKMAAEYVLGLGGKKVPKYRHEAILARLSVKFFLVPDYISQILREDDAQIPDTQLNIFNQEEQ